MSSTWKTVRVFISSTFHDMQAERDYLVRFVFPRLREQLLPRRIHLVDVDLRWGVTSEQDAAEVCREIIDECRPRFLCMLGGRYGTIPQGRELSITADEIHFGVLNARQERLYAMFYFRRGTVTHEMDRSTPGSIREPRHSGKAAKLARLKRQIRQSNCRPFLYRPRWNAEEQRLLDLKAFGDRVASDLLATIDDEFSTQPPEQLDEFAEENAAMEAFVEERTERFVLGSREAVLKELLAHAGGSAGNGYICLTGAPGSGKSALLAYLCRCRQSEASGVRSSLVIAHFVGASPGSTDVRRTLRRFCHELKAGCPGIATEIPDDLEKLQAAFPDFLRQACATRRVVLLLDAINQFDLVSNPAGLYWLPDDLPENARIILSSLDSPALEELRRRPHPPHEIELKALTASDAEAIIEQFHRRYRKTFEAGQRATLLTKTDAGTPLYLLAALEELRTLGTYEEITSRITQLPPDTQALFTWIFRRLENDEGFRDTAGRKIGHELVPRFASLLGASRHGLSHRELTDLLDPGDPQGNVAALLYLLRPYLMRRGELLDFYHGQFRDAVRAEILSADVDQRAAHLALADYFERQPVDSRTATELPWQLREAYDWTRLKECITNMSVFAILLTHNKYESLGYWAALAKQYDMVDTCQNILQNVTAQTPSLVGPTYSMIGAFFETAGKLSEAGEFSRRACEIAERTLGSEHPLVAMLLNNWAVVLMARGDFATAEPVLRRALALCKKAFGEEHLQSATTMNHLAQILKDKGDYIGAESLLKHCLAIRQELLGMEHADVAQVLCNLGELKERQGDLVKAEELYRQALALREKLFGPNHPEVAASLSNLGGLLHAKGDLAGAERLHRRAVAICERVFGERHPNLAGSLNLLGLLLRDKGDLDQAEVVFERALTMLEETPGPENPTVADVLNNLAGTHCYRGNLEKAEPLFWRALSIYERSFEADHPHVGLCLHGLALIKHRKGDYMEAERLCLQALEIWRHRLGQSHLYTRMALHTLTRLRRDRDH